MQLEEIPTLFVPVIWWRRDGFKKEIAKNLSLLFRLHEGIKPLDYIGYGGF